MENTESLDADVILPGAEFRRMLDELAAAQSENARLREAALLGEFYRDQETDQIYMANFCVLSKGDGRQKLASKGATFPNSDALMKVSVEDAVRAFCQCAPAEKARLAEIEAAARALCDAWDANGFSAKCLVVGSPSWLLYNAVRRSAG